MTINAFQKALKIGVLEQSLATIPTSIDNNKYEKKTVFLLSEKTSIRGDGKKKNERQKFSLEVTSLLITAYLV